MSAPREATEILTKLVKENGDLVDTLYSKLMQSVRSRTGKPPVVERQTLQLINEYIAGNTALEHTLITAAIEVGEDGNLYRAVTTMMHAVSKNVTKLKFVKESLSTTTSDVIRVAMSMAMKHQRMMSEDVTLPSVDKGLKSVSAAVEAQSRVLPGETVMNGGRRSKPPLAPTIVANSTSLFPEIGVRTPTSDDESSIHDATTTLGDYMKLMANAKVMDHFPTTSSTIVASSDEEEGTEVTVDDEMRAIYAMGRYSSASSRGSSEGYASSSPDGSELQKRLSALITSVDSSLSKFR